MSQPVFVIGHGASTPVGRSAAATAAAVRAGISGFAHHPQVRDSEGEPVQVAPAPWLDIDLQGSERFAALLFPAIEEALDAVPDLRRRLPRDRVALALALPAPRPGLPEDIGRALLERVQRRFDGLFGAVAGFAQGHPATLLALGAALPRLAQGKLDACLVVGVDSWLAPDTLRWLEAEDQLHGAGALNNAWGFIPGEAAAALLVMNEQTAAALRATPQARVLGVGQGQESKGRQTQTVCIGEGLTDALRSALGALPPSTLVSDTYCDMNGQPQRADEFGFAALRTKDSFVAASDFRAPADCWGDVGAAGGALHVGLACTAAARRYAKGRVAIAWSSAADAPERAAVLLDTHSGRAAQRGG